MIDSILDILFPKRCVGCKKFGDFLCASCFSTISFNATSVCVVCNRSSIGGVTHPLCATRFTIDGVISSYTYQGVVKRLLHAFKYRPYMSSLRDTIGRLFEEQLLQNEVFYGLAKKNPLILPVPLHKMREQRRGYNHAALLAYYVAQCFSLEYREGVLIRIKNTKPHFGLKKEARMLNVKNAFGINSSLQRKIEDKGVLLIDDLATTCSTLRECARVLKRHGACFVWGATFAREQ